MNTSHTFDPGVDAETFADPRPAKGWPLDAAVNFLLRHAPKDRRRSDVRVLELRCSADDTESFAAREGFDTTSLRLVDFTQLPFEDGRFDLAIDLGALSSVGRSVARRALGELARVLQPSGRLFFNPYSDRHTSARSGRLGPDDLTLDVGAGSLSGRGQLCFWNAQQVTAALVEDWRVLSRQHVEFEEQERSVRAVHAEWRLVAQKVA